MATLAGAWAGGVLLLVAVHVVFPQRDGVLALTQVFEPLIVLSGLVAAVVAALLRLRWAALIGAALFVVVAARYGPVIVSLPASAAGEGDALSAVTWNVIAGNRDAERAAAGLAAVEADLVGLQELQPPTAELLTSDPTFTSRYPHRVLDPDYSVYGLGLLSRHEILEHQSWSDPPLLRALVEPHGQEAIAVYVAHPMPVRISSVAGVPVAVHTARRDAGIQFIRAQIETDLQAGRKVIVLGDFNVTEREPAYRDLTAGLRDAHLDAGIGPGLTWRPPEVNFLPFGLLRIDYVLTSPDIEARATHVECTPNSDHCLLAADLVTRQPEGLTR